MARRPKFTLEYAPEVYEHLEAIHRKYHRLIAQAIKEQLTYTPELSTQNRKSLEEPMTFGATWELRFGSKNSFRVFYEVEQAEKIVFILAIGVKAGNRLLIGGEEFET